MLSRIQAPSLPACTCPPRATAGPVRRVLQAVARRMDAPLSGIAVVLVLLALLAPA